MKRFNWQIWAGALLSFIALAGHPFVFIEWPLNRNFPWVSVLLFAAAALLLFVGVRRGFAATRTHPTRSRIAASIGATISVLALAAFVFAFFVAGRWLPASEGAPKVGQKAPEFTLADTTGKQVSLAELRSTLINGKAPIGVLLIFYRGYW